MSWGVRAAGLVLTGVLVISTVISSPALAVPPDPCPGPLSCGDDLTEAMELETKIQDNFWYGQAFEIDYGSAARTPGDVVGIGAFGDSALWTGTYLGSQAFRYATAKHWLDQNPLPGGDRNDWMAHRGEAKERVKGMVEKFHQLVNISKNWNHEFAPSLTPFGFGGGVFKGEPGYLMRACIPEDAPAGFKWGNTGMDPNGLPRPYTANRRVFGPLDWDDGKKYFCEDGTSRDAYAGTIFGLLLAFDLVGPDDPPMREQIQKDIVTLSNFAFKYLWNTPRPHGRVSIPFGTNQNSSPCSDINPILQICGHDFENFFSPLFVYTPSAQMEMTQAAYHVLTEGPEHPDRTKWEAIFAVELAVTAPFLAFAEEFDAAMPYNDYYKWNLEHLIAFNLVRMAPNDVARTIYKHALGVMDATTGDDVNAHFEAVTFGLTGETSRRDAAILHLRQWRDYRDRIDQGAPTVHLVDEDPEDDVPPHCVAGLDCVPEDQLDVTLTPGAPPVVIPGVSEDLRAHFPLDVADRRPADFLWQRAPNQLKEPLRPPEPEKNRIGEAEELRRHQAPGIDYLLPYWMLRYLTEVETPARASFPAWPGPSFD